MDAPDILHLHIGLPKTATTYLQREVFPTYGHLTYIGIPRGDVFTAAKDHERDRRTLTNCVQRSVEVWAGRGDAIFESVFGCVRSERPAGDALLSDEGVGRSGSRPALLAAHLGALAQAARSWGFGSVTVLCAVRRQDQWLASHYAQVSDRNPDASQADFEVYVRQTLSPTSGRYGFGMLLDYAALVEHVSDVVGEENILVLPYEMLSQDPSAFLNCVSSFVGGATETATAGRRQNVRSRGEDVWALGLRSGSPL